MVASARLGFAVSMKTFFGLLPGEQTSGFFQELKALSQREKEEFHQMLLGAGIDCDPPLPVQKKE